MSKNVFASTDERRAFLDKLQNWLRQGEQYHAWTLARDALRRVPVADKRLVRLALDTEVDDVIIRGWETLGATLRALDADAPITAISIDLSWPGHFAQRISDGVLELDYQDDGGLEPVLETNYFRDIDDIAFSTADRKTLLKGYSGHGSIWQGMFDEINDQISIEGLDELYGAVQ